MSDAIRIDTRLGDTLAFGNEKPETFYRNLVDFDITVNGERMVLIDFLGMGNMAGVLEAVYADGDNEGKSVAVKVLSPELAARQHFVERFRNEALTMMELPSHPNLVDCFFFGTDERTMLHFMGLEFVPGRSLDDMETSLSVREIFDIVKQVAAGLATAHEKKKIHRDIKPGNILVLPDGSAKLSDFGLVRGIGDVRHTAVGTALGTPLYMAPEQIRGRANFGSDLYSVGATFYEALTGVPPYTGEDAEEVFLKIEDPEVLPDPIRKHNPDVSIELEQIILRTLAKDFRHRHLTVREFLKDLEALETQSFERDVKESWLLTHRRDEGRRSAFRLIELSQSFGLVREPSVQGLRSVIDECRVLQRERIRERLHEVDLDQAEYDTQVRYVENLERLLQITPQTPDTVLDRIGWIETMQGVWQRIVTEDPSLNQALTQTQYMLGWEEHQRERFGVVKPEPPLTFWERHGRRIVASVIVLLVLGLLGSLAFIVAIYHRARAERRRAQEAYAGLYYRSKKKVGFGAFDEVEEGLKELRGLAAKLDDPLRAMELDDLEESLEEARLEATSRELLEGARSRLRRALDLVRTTREQGLDRDDRDALVQEASTLHKETSAVLPDLLPMHAESLQRELDAVVTLIGPQIYAFQTFDTARAKAAEIAEKLAAFRKQWKKKGTLSVALVSLERRGLEGARNNLLGVQRDFLDDQYKPLPRFVEVLRRTNDLIDEIKDFEADISQAQRNRAQAEIARVDDLVNGLIRGQHYLDEDAMDRHNQIKALFASITALIENLPRENRIWAKAAQALTEDLGQIRDRYADTGKKIDELVAVREGAEKGDVEATLKLAKQLFHSAEYDQARKLFEKALSKAKNPASSKLCEEAQASLHLAVIRLETLAASDDGKIWVRDGLTSSEVAELEARIRDLGSKEESKTPHHRFLDVLSRLQAIGRVPALKGIATDALNKTASLKRAAWALMALEDEAAEKPDDEALQKRLQLERSRYLGAATGEYGRGFAPLAEAAEAARKFVEAGRREVAPAILLSLGSHYADLGMKNDARVQYQRFLHMGVGDDALRAEVKRELEALDGD